MKRFLLMFLALMLVGPALRAAPESAAKPDGTKYKIFVQDVRLVGLDAQYAKIYSSFIAEAIQELGLFDVVTSQDLHELVDYESLKEIMTCDSVSCLAQIGGVAVADMMLTCDISKFPDNISVALNLSSVESLKKIKTSTEMLSGDSTLQLNKMIPLQTKLIFSQYLTDEKNDELALELALVKGSDATSLKKAQEEKEKKLKAEQEKQAKAEKEKQAQAAAAAKKLKAEQEKRAKAEKEKQTKDKKEKEAQTTQLTPQLKGERTAAIITGGIGVAAIITGAIISGKATRRYKSYDDRIRDDFLNSYPTTTRLYPTRIKGMKAYVNDVKSNNKLAIAGIVTWATGSALAVTSLALGIDFALKNKAPKVVALPTFSSDGAQLTLSYRW